MTHVGSQRHKKKTVVVVSLDHGVRSAGPRKPIFVHPSRAFLPFLLLLGDVYICLCSFVYPAWLGLKVVLRISFVGLHLYHSNYSKAAFPTNHSISVCYRYGRMLARTGRNLRKKTGYLTVSSNLLN